MSPNTQRSIPYSLPLSHRAGAMRCLLPAAALLTILMAGCGGSGSSNAAANTTPSGATSNATGPTITSTEYAYVVNRDDSTVAQFKIAANGVLTPLTPATVPTAPSGTQILVTPNNAYAYVLSQDVAAGTMTAAATVSQYKVNANGTLTPLSPATVSLGQLIVNTNTQSNTTLPISAYTRLAMDPQGRFLYAISDQGVLNWAIQANGTLGPFQLAASLSSPATAFCLDPAGGFAYIGFESTQAQAPVIEPLKVNSDGTLTQMPAQQIVVSGGKEINNLAMDPKGRFLYASNLLVSTKNNPLILAQYQVAADGSLTALKTTSLALTQASDFPAALALYREDIGFVQLQPTFDPSDKFAYLPTQTPLVMEESVGSDGSFTPIGSGAVPSGASTSCVDIEPSGKFVYVANQDTSVGEFSINTDGTLLPLATPAINTGSRPISIATTFVTTTAAARFAHPSAASR